MSCLGFESHSDTIRYFPVRRSHQTNQLFLEDILLKSLLAHLKVTRQLNINIRSHGTIIVRNHDLSLSVGKYYTINSDQDLTKDIQ